MFIVSGHIKTTKRVTDLTEVTNKDGEKGVKQITADDQKVCGFCANFKLRYIHIDGGYCRHQRGVKNALERCDKFKRKE